MKTYNLTRARDRLRRIEKAWYSRRFHRLLYDMSRERIYLQNVIKRMDTKEDIMLSDRIRKMTVHHYASGRSMPLERRNEIANEVGLLEQALRTILPYIQHPDVQAIPFALPVSNIERMIVRILAND